VHHRAHEGHEIDVHGWLGAFERLTQALFDDRCQCLALVVLQRRATEQLRLHPAPLEVLRTVDHQQHVLEQGSVFGL
jgi:hypothetical protein